MCPRPVFQNQEDTNTWECGDHVTEQQDGETRAQAPGEVFGVEQRKTPSRHSAVPDAAAGGCRAAQDEPRGQGRTQVKVTDGEVKAGHR